jgi:hypothetical protein
MKNSNDTIWNRNWECIAVKLLMNRFRIGCFVFDLFCRHDLTVFYTHNSCLWLLKVQVAFGTAVFTWGGAARDCWCISWDIQPFLNQRQILVFFGYLLQVLFRIWASSYTFQFDTIHINKLYYHYQWIRTVQSNTTFIVKIQLYIRLHVSATWSHLQASTVE